MEETPTQTLKKIIPSSATKSVGSPFTVQPRSDLDTVTTSSSSLEGEFVLDYKDKNGRPYLVDLLGSRFLYDEKDTRDDFDTVDEWITMEITRRGLNGKKEAYREVVKDISKKLQMPKTISAENKVKQMATLLRKALDAQRYYQKMGIDLKSLEEIYGGT